MLYLETLVIRPVDKDEFDSCGAGRTVISASVADKVRSAEIDRELLRRIQQHSRFRLPAKAVIRVGVRAYFDFIQVHAGLEPPMHLVQSLPAHLAASDRGLIGHKHGDESRGAEASDGLSDIREHGEIFKSQRAVRILAVWRSA